MAKTLLQFIVGCARRCGIDPTITSFSDDDETQLLVDFTNEGIAELREKLPWVPYLDKNGSLSLIAGTRLYSVAADAQAVEIFNWSYQDNATHGEITPATLEYIQELDAEYQTKQGTPTHVYQEGAQLGFYPVPSANMTVPYVYPLVPSELSSTSATFPYPDEWLRWLKLYVLDKYLGKKGLGDKEERKRDLMSAYALIYADVAKANPSYIR